MEYTDRLRDAMVNAYQLLQNFVDYTLYGDKLGFAYVGADFTGGRDFSRVSLDHVLFMSCRKLKGHKAKQGETWVNQNNGQEVKVKGRKRPRKSKRMRRVHKK